MTSFHQQSFLEQVLDGTPSGLIVVDPGSRIIYVNCAGERILNRTSDDICQSLYDDEQWGITNCLGEKMGPDELPLGRVLKTGKAVRGVRHTVLLPDGRRRYLRVSAAPMYRDGDEIHHVVVSFDDITDEFHVQHNLEEVEERLNQIAESVQEVFWIRGTDEVLFVNAAYERVWGRTRGSLYADPKAFLADIHPEDRGRVEDAFQREQREMAMVNEIFRVVRADGSQRWVHTRSYPVDYRERRIAVTAVDITEAKEAQEALEWRASVDPLTGLWNRYQFDARFQDAFIRYNRYSAPACLILFDIDRFKSVNDRFGHAIGDDVLRGIARRLAPVLRELDIFARWGGEEFVILLPETSIDYAMEVAERLREEVEGEGFPVVGTVTISVGVTDFRCNDAQTLEVLNRADRALYSAKGKGRNRVEAALD